MFLCLEIWYTHAKAMHDCDFTLNWHERVGPPWIIWCITIDTEWKNKLRTGKNIKLCPCVSLSMYVSVPLCITKSIVPKIWIDICNYYYLHCIILFLFWLKVPRGWIGRTMEFFSWSYYFGSVWSGVMTSALWWQQQQQQQQHPHLSDSMYGPCILINDLFHGTLI